jgi:hypothetical protein
MEFVLAKERAKRRVLGTPEADEAWLEVSKLAEILVSTHMLTVEEEFNTYQSALRAAFHARAILRARELYRRYGATMSMDERKRWDDEFYRLLFEKARTDLPLEEFGSMMSLVCARESSADPEGWSSECPLWGHCLVIALLVQDIYGGTLLRQSLRGVEGFEHFGSHYSNRLPDDRDLDLTAGVLCEKLGTHAPKEEYPREKALSRADNLKGYLVLKEAFINELIKWMKATYPEPQDD